MKTFFYLTTLMLAGIISINAQIVNSSFEDWTSGQPDGWYTNNAGLYLAAEQSSDAYDGSSALKIQVVDIGAAAMGPIVVLGTPENSGMAISSKYTSISGYYKYFPTGGDKFDITVTLEIGDQLIAQGEFIVTETAGEYTNFSVPITYYNEGDPDHCNIYISIQSEDGQNPPTIGSYAIVDNLSFTLNSTGTEEIELPADFSLSQNYPNPFNPSTTITYSIPESGNVQLSVYDISGQLIQTLVNEQQNTGTYKVTFDGSNLASGIYLYRLTTGNNSFSKKLMLLK